MRNAARTRRYGFMLLAAALTLASSADVAGPVAAGVSTPAGVSPASLLPGSAELHGVYCTASTNCWAVGLKNSAQRALLDQIVHWNGKKWGTVSVASPGGTKTGDFSELLAVRCTSASNCWAVGRYQGVKDLLPQLLHWNGKKWRQTTVPIPGGTGTGDLTELNDVVCTSASSCLAVGDYGNEGVSSRITFNLAIRWNGKKWSKVNTPNPAGTSQNDLNSLEAVRCGSAKDCWAAGTSGVEVVNGVQLNEMLHWNGRKWFTAKVPSPGGSMSGAFNIIDGLSCTSASNCWAVGAYGRETVSSSHLANQALHWNGRKWSRVKTPNPAGTAPGDSNTLLGVNCTAVNNCWAVGSFEISSLGNVTTGEALHWNGTKWSLAKTPEPGGTASNDQNEFASVRCVSPKDCWIVGFSRMDPDPDLNLTLHWNNVRWSVK